MKLIDVNKINWEKIFGGCVFMNSGKCPQRAVTYCCSNGGNILVKAN